MAHVSMAYMRQQIRTLSYVVSTHAADELDDDNLEILDLENIILTGEVVERQRDRFTREAKYRIQGKTLGGSTLGRTAENGEVFAFKLRDLHHRPAGSDEQ